jgi:tellurite methyltransferase
MKEVFWEKSYENKKINTFEKPSKEIEGLTSKLSKGSSILDMACGEGRHGLFLAQNGFQVDAFDISENGIDKLKRIAMENDIKLNAWAEDIFDDNSALLNMGEPYRIS